MRYEALASWLAGTPRWLHRSLMHTPGGEAGAACVATIRWFSLPDRVTIMYSPTPRLPKRLHSISLSVASALLIPTFALDAHAASGLGFSLGSTSSIAISTQSTSQLERLYHIAITRAQRLADRAAALAQRAQAASEAAETAVNRARANAYAARARALERASALAAQRRATRSRPLTTRSLMERPFSPLLVPTRTRPAIFPARVRWLMALTRKPNTPSAR